MSSPTRKLTSPKVLLFFFTNLTIKMPAGDKDAALLPEGERSLKFKDLRLGFDEEKIRTFLSILPGISILKIRDVALSGIMWILENYKVEKLEMTLTLKRGHSANDVIKLAKLIEGKPEFNRIVLNLSGNRCRIIDFLASCRHPSITDLCLLFSDRLVCDQTTDHVGLLCEVLRELPTLESFTMDYKMINDDDPRIFTCLATLPSLEYVYLIFSDELRLFCLTNIHLFATLGYRGTLQLGFRTVEVSLLSEWLVSLLSGSNFKQVGIRFCHDFYSDGFEDQFIQFLESLPSIGNKTRDLDLGAGVSSVVSNDRFIDRLMRCLAKIRMDELRLPFAFSPEQLEKLDYQKYPNITALHVTSEDVASANNFAILARNRTQRMKNCKAAIRVILWIRRFRKSELSEIHKDIVRLVCESLFVTRFDPEWSH